MAEKNDASRGGMGSPIKLIIIGAVFIVIVVVVIFSKPKPKENIVVQNPESITEQDSTDGALHVTQQVVSGDYTYEFRGVRWIFDTESPEVAETGQTWLKMELVDFTRNGSAIAIGRPYKLGVHAGACKNADFIDTSTETGIPISYAVCEGEGIKREFTAFQELETITVKMKETKAGESSVWKDWYEIDVTEIVR